MLECPFRFRAFEYWSTGVPIRRPSTHRAEQAVTVPTEPALVCPTLGHPRKNLAWVVAVVAGREWMVAVVVGGCRFDQGWCVVGVGVGVQC